MHNVSNAWKENQNSQLRKKTNIKGFIFVGEEKVSRVVAGLPAPIDNQCISVCPECLAFTHLSKGKHIDFELSSAITLKFGSDVSFDCAPLNSDTTLANSIFITLYDGHSPSSSTILLQKTNLANLINTSTTISGVEMIRFELDGNGNADELGICKYFSSKKPIELKSGDIETLTYRGHAKVLNENLPYQKITLRTIEKSLPYILNCAYFEIGYDEIDNGDDEYIPLGSGYYYLDTANYDEFKQQYVFKDTIASLTNPYIYKPFSSDLNLTITSLASRGLTTTVKLYPNYKPNFDFSSLGNTITAYIPMDKTVGEVLQMIGQADCKTLYLNEYNLITYKDFRYSTILQDDNPVWILNKPKIVKGAKPKRLQVKTYSIRRDTAQQFTITSFTATSSGYACLNFDKAYYLLTVNNRTLDQIGGIDNITYIEFYANSGTTYTIGASAYYEIVNAYADVFTISSNGEADYTLDLYVVSTNVLGGYKDYYTYWLSKYYDLSLETRLDPKYTLLDILQSDKYGAFIIEDIEATYNGGYRGRISGRIIEPKIKAPILKSRNIASISNYTFEIYNPNTDFPVDLIVHYSSGDLTYTIMPLETLELNHDNASDLEYAVGYWLDDDLTNEVFCYFEYDDDLTSVQSDNTILLNEIQAPVLSNVDLVSDTDYSFEITNDNDMEMELYFHRSSGDLYDTYTLQPHETMVFDHDNLGDISTDVYYYLLGDLHDEVYCWFRNQHGTTTDNTIILEANFNE